MKKYIITLISIWLFTIEVVAQITYSDGKLNINNAKEDVPYELRINNWQGMYWTCKEDNFFQLDVTASHPRLAGTGGEVVFYDTSLKKFNSIQVANVYNYSDARAKSNVKNISTGLNAILQLRPVTYNWNNTVDSISANAISDYAAEPEKEELQYGFLAQEVETVLPDAVHTDSEGRKLINYTAIIPLLVQAIQDLQATVDAQATQIEKLSLRQQGASIIEGNRIKQCFANQSNGKAVIQLDLKENVKNASILITSLTGDKEKTINVTSKNLNISEDISSLKNGIHIVSLLINGEILDSKRLVKE